MICRFNAWSSYDNVHHYLGGYRYRYPRPIVGHPGRGYFRSYLIRLPNYDSTKCQCSEPVQTAKHLLLGCPLYREEREKAGIQRETTLQGLLFTQKGTAALIDFIQETGVATRKWLLQGTREKEEEDSWGWGSLREVQERDGEEDVE